jgi:hypothetical protein
VNNFETSEGPGPKTFIRTTILLIALLVIFTSIVPMLLRAFADEPIAALIPLTTTGVGPRDVEETTQAAIQRQYTAAWKNMADALQQNRIDLLDQAFVGAARAQLVNQIEQQKKTGVSDRLIDRGHNASIIFYSPEGTAIQLRDNVDLEQQILDGGKVIHTEHLRQPYLVIFTLVEDRWKVRTLQAVPGA